MSLKHTVTFSPVGGDEQQNRVIEFDFPSRKKEVIQTKAYERARRKKLIDRYSLYNHWKISNLEIEYIDKPWNSVLELGEELLTFSGVVDYGRGGYKLEKQKEWLVTVEPKLINNAENQIRNYYKFLNPKKVRENEIKIQVKPKYIE